MKNHYFQMDDRALWSELRSGSLIAANQCIAKIMKKVTNQNE